MNNKLNNRNIFSIKLFWQSFRQLKIIGLISAAIMLLITGLPIIMDGINITNNIKAVKPAGDASLSTVQDYTSIVYPSSATAVLIIVFAFITPVLALYLHCTAGHSLIKEAQVTFITLCHIKDSAFSSPSLQP